MTSRADAVPTRGDDPYSLRAAEAMDVAILGDLERRAAVRFADIGLAVLAEGEPTPREVFAAAREDGLLWVVEAVPSEGAQEGEVVGFALARFLETSLHLQEMDVLPEHGRRGLGRRLVEVVLTEAPRRGRRLVTLTTFRDVPWNGPFYARLGFEEWPAERLPAELRRLVARELDAGLLPELRCVMRRRV